ncbi:MAG TPA: dihydroneopterin aldolase [Rhizomicrobium sp.]|jgi:dihydroneopterin aldolase
MTAASTLRHVFIRNLELLAHIGIHGHEHTKHQPVRINVDMTIEDAAALEDRLDRVVDYEAITLRIRALVARGHINLAETLAESIATSCLDDKRVKSVRVCVEKLHAVPGAESAGVEIERRAAPMYS